jgi:hypothetical protein
MLRMDELKTRYAQKLWERVTPENVAVTLCCAEAHNCPELKARCIDFFFSPAVGFFLGASLRAGIARVYRVIDPRPENPRLLDLTLELLETYTRA